MTGFGRGSASSDGRSITIELKSVNHKYLDLNFRLPRSLNYLEETLRTAISAKLSRGHLDINLSYMNTREDAKSITLDSSLIAQYIEAGNSVAQQFNVENDLTVTTLLRFPDVVNIADSQDDEEEVKKLALSAVSQALSELAAMRVREGNNIYEDIIGKLKYLELLHKQMQERAPMVVAQYSQRLHERISAWLNEVDIDKARIATEIALFADKVSIDEELVRIKSHLNEFNAMLNSTLPVGRSMDFLTQELTREFNTIGSKANDSELAKMVITAKAEVEKIREQVQNIE
jgi:uncharacterized protein (TIGR00255 family)